MSVKTVLQKIGEDFKKGLDAVLPYAKTVGEEAVSIYAPALGPLFNKTVCAVAMAEQNFAALGKQSGTGASKLAAATQIVGGLIKQGLEDAGKPNDEAAVQGYINSVVTILNSAPAA